MELSSGLHQKKGAVYCIPAETIKIKVGFFTLDSRPCLIHGQVFVNWRDYFICTGMILYVLMLVFTMIGFGVRCEAKEDQLRYPGILLQAKSITVVYNK